MKPQTTFRPATRDDLTAINRVISSAILNWPMSERARRLAVPVSQYDETDIGELELFVCVHRNEVIGVAAYNPEYCGKTGLLHGLYVLPIVQGQGIGKALMQEVFRAATAREQTGVLVKAQRVSAGYFEHCHLERVESAANEYPYQYFKPVSDAA